MPRRHAMLAALHRWEPALPKHWHFLVSGTLWAGVGLLLGSMAARWLQPLAWPRESLLVLAGLAFGALMYRLGFAPVALRNIHRLRGKPARFCVFAFQAWRGYAVVAFMMALGIVLRHSPLSPQVLAVLYLGIGSGLAVASVAYYREALRTLRGAS